MIRILKTLKYKIICNFLIYSITCLNTPIHNGILAEQASKDLLVYSLRLILGRKYSGENTSDRILGTNDTEYQQQYPEGSGPTTAVLICFSKYMYVYIYLSRLFAHLSCPPVGAYTHLRCACARLLARGEQKR